jgi:hypothetical protein
MLFDIPIDGKSLDMGPSIVSSEFELVRRKHRSCAFRAHVVQRKRADCFTVMVVEHNPG